MDLSLSKRSGIEATEAIVAKQLQSKVLILSRHFDKGIVRQALSAGAAGYVLKQRPFAALLAAVRAVAAGKESLDGCLGNCTRVSGSGSTLTERQEQIVKLIARGYRTDEIARQLKIAVKTVEAHRAATFKKLGLSNRREFLQYAWLRGWLSGE
jgi:DNA-binding NarL/FixJ family response regulator